MTRMIPPRPAALPAAGQRGPQESRPASPPRAWREEAAITSQPVPDLGAVRAAGVLSARLGMPVTADGVTELGRRGLIPVVGSYKGHELYDGRAVELFTDVAAAADATWAGHLRTTDESAAYLRVRRADLAHLVRAGMLRPADYGYGPYDRRRRPTVPLYRTGDLDALAAAPGIDWAAVRATPAGRRSPLASLKTAGGAS
jgi:hypothetical protein